MFWKHILASMFIFFGSAGAQSVLPSADLASLLADSHYDEVITQGMAALLILQTENPGGSLEEAEIIDLVVNAAYRSRQVMDDRFLLQARRSVELKERHGAGVTEIAESFLHLGSLKNNRREYRDAITELERGLVLLERDGADHSGQKAPLLSGIGMAYRRLGELGQALDSTQRALVLQEKTLGPDDPELAATLNNLALINRNLGYYSRAREQYLRALDLREPVYGLDDVLVGKLLNNLATLLGYMGEYKESLEVQERAVESLVSRLGPDHPSCLWARFNLGVAYLEMGDHQGARPICEEVLRALQGYYGEDHIETVFALDALGSCMLKGGEPEQALEMYTKSRAIAERDLGVGNHGTADTIGLQGRCLVVLGRLDEASLVLGASLDIWQRSLGQDSPEVCGTLHALAELELKRGNPDLALRYAEQSAEVVRNSIGGFHPFLAEALLLEGQAYFASGRFGLARQRALEAENISRAHLQTTLRALSEGQALDYASVRTQGLDLALASLESGSPGQETASVWDAVVRSRAVVLDEFTARNRLMVRLAGTPAAVLADSSLILRERLGNLSLRGPGWEDIQEYRKMLDDTRSELNLLERRLSMESSVWNRSDEFQDIGWSQVEDALPPGAGLVSYVRHRDFVQGGRGDPTYSYKALVLGRAGAEPVMVDLGDTDLIDDLVQQWQDQVEFGSHGGQPTRGLMRVPTDQDRNLAAYQEAGTRLRERIWDPVAEMLGDTCRVFVVPAGTINLVNLASLPTDDGRFLIEQDRMIHLLASERTIASPSPSKPGSGLLIFSDPDFGSPGAATGVDPARGSGQVHEPEPCLSLSDLGFAPLPLTRAEAEKVVSIWNHLPGSAAGQVNEFRGGSATESAFKIQAPGHRALHLATHGFFLPGHCSSGENKVDRPWDSLVSSGLVFAEGNRWQEAPQGWEDGILTAQEVAALDLNGVQWVVLSACSTGLGNLSSQGEGVFGLRRAFTLAGARTLVMSLWSVDDESALEWMTELYKAGTDRGLDAAESYWIATRSVLDSRRREGRSLHPHLWGAFVAAGDWRHPE